MTELWLVLLQAVKQGDTAIWMVIVHHQEHKCLRVDNSQGINSIRDLLWQWGATGMMKVAIMGP